MPKQITVVALAPLLLAAAPAASSNPEPPLVLNCYVVQSGDLTLGQFVRHLEVHPDRGIVSVSDAMQGRSPRWLGNGKLVTLDADHLVYDFASTLSAGRTEIDRRSGNFTYNDGRTVIEGSCQPSTL